MTVSLSNLLVTFSRSDPGGWSELIGHARLLDEVRFDRIVMSEHVVFGESLEAYGRPESGGQSGGRQPTGPDGHWLEPMVTLSLLAGVTSHIRLGTNILLAALRRPVVLAKQAATLDVLSGGRLDLGVGVGWQRAEYDAAGLSFDDRGRLLDETLDLCRRFWTDPVVVYESESLSFGPTHMMPKPTGPRGVPIWVSGTLNPRVVRRLARFGSGWIPWGRNAIDPEESIPRLRDLLERQGRDSEDLEISWPLPTVRADGGTIEIEPTVEQIPRLVAAGVTDLQVRLRPTDMERRTLIDFVAAVRERSAE